APAARAGKRRSTHRRRPARAAQASGRPTPLRRHGRGGASRAPGTPVTRTVLKGAAAVAVLFTVVLALTFPTDDLVRWVLSRVPVPEGYNVTFQRAHLRPWGLVLDDAAYRRSDGRPVIELDWLRVRPSWTAF